MLAYLKGQYLGYGVEFNFQPDNTLLKKLLLEAGATVFPEQRNMEWTGPVPSADMSGVEYLSKENEPRYFALHRENDPDGETYWTGEKVAEDQTQFCVFLARKDGIPVGYLDLGLDDRGNNVADLYVTPACRRRGWGRRLLAAAMERTMPKRLTLQVDVDNYSAIRLYESMGFRPVPNSEQVDAIWRIDG